MNHEPQSESPTATAPNSAPAAEQPSAQDTRNRAGRFRAKLPFFRTMLWVLLYAIAVLFFFALILVGGFRVQTDVIGSAWLACAALLVATYVLHWRR